MHTIHIWKKSNLLNLRLNELINIKAKEKIVLDSHANFGKNWLGWING